MLGFADKLSPRLRAVREQVARAEGARTAAFAAFLPEVEARYRHIQGTESFALPTLPTLVGNVAYAKSDLEIGAPVIGGLSVGESSALMYDAGLRLHLPLGGLIGGLSPFVQAGAGAMRQEVRVAPAATRSTDFAYNVGGGVDLGLAPGVGLQLMVKDYIGKFNAREATSLDLDGRTAHNWTVSAGVRLGL